ncbi:hypothetical protein ASE46_03985 [Bacillus sp. Root239]|nr:hypothetical protein ASE46_03985 [Bacillus sp. Root239]
MYVNELQEAFIAVKQYEPQSSNELLDFAQQQYLKGFLTPLNYKAAVRELEQIGATKPDFSAQDD